MKTKIMYDGEEFEGNANLGTKKNDIIMTSI